MYNSSLKSMRLFLKSNLIFFAACGSLSLIACGNSELETNTPASSETVTPLTVTTLEDDHDHSHHDHFELNAQVILSGHYRLELVPELTDDGIILDFYLETEASNEPIPHAEVTARVQLPNGDEKMLDMLYRAEDKHYLAFLPEQAKGVYTITILTEINGEKLSGQYSVDQ